MPCEPPEFKTRPAEAYQQGSYLYDYVLNIHPSVPGVIVSRACICHPSVINRALCPATDRVPTVWGRMGGHSGHLAL